LIFVFPPLVTINPSLTFPLLREGNWIFRFPPLVRGD
jgi:hypothetical protein